MRKSNPAVLLILAVLISSCSPPASPAAPPFRGLTPRAALSNTETPIASSPPSVMGCSRTSLRIRREPNAQSEILGALQAGECVSVHEVSGDATWAAVEHDGYSGWVALQYLTIEGDMAQLEVAGGPVVRTEVATWPTATPQPTWTPKVEAYSTKAPSLAAGGLLSCANAGKYVGEIVTCRLSYTYCVYQPDVSGSPTLCNDRPLPENNFSLVAWDTDWSRYDGKCLVISGLVSEANGKAQIEAGGATQVSLCP